MQFFPLVLCALISLVPEAAYYAYQSFLQAEQDGPNYTLNSIVYMLIYALFNVLFIVFCHLNALGMVITMILAPFIMTVYGIFNMIRKNNICFLADLSILKRILVYSVPVVPHDLSAMSVTYISKIFLNHSVSFAATGLFTVASQISTAMSLVQSSMNLAFHPWFNQQMIKGAEGRKNIKSFSVFIFAFYCYISIFIAFFSPEVLSVITPPAYKTAWKFVPFLVLVLVVNFIYYTHILSILYNIRASKFIMICSLTGAVLNIVLSNDLIKMYASWGAVLAYFISRLVTVLVAVIYSRIVQPVDFGLLKMCMLTIATAIIISLGLSYGWLHNINGINFFNIIFKLFIIIIISIVVFYCNRKVLIEYAKVLILRKF